MAKANYSSDLSISETGNWNSARFYAQILSSYIADIVEYRKVCYFGTTDMTVGMMIDEATKDKAKIDALLRWIKTEQCLIRDSMFAIKSSKLDKESLSTHLNQLNELEKLQPKVKREIRIENRGTKTTIIKIEKTYYDFIVEQLNRIHESILLPLNKNDLIFMGSEDYDVNERKEEMKRRIIEST